MTFVEAENLIPCAGRDEPYDLFMQIRFLFAMALVPIVMLAPPGQAQSPVRSDAAFLLERSEIVLPSGRKMNLVCAGSGSPTVVVESGLGSHMLHWQKVAGRMSRMTKTCFYDRAGFGFSDPSPNSLTATSVTDDLYLLLRQAKIKGSVVLVGHSLGGLYATVYANRFRKGVAGMVLIEPSFAQQDKDLTPAQRQQDETSFKTSVAGLRSCAAQARTGKLSTEPHEECFAFAPNRTPEEKAFLTYQFTRPFRYEAMATAIEAQHSGDGRSDANSKAGLATRRSYGNMPLVVLTAERAQNSTETPAERELAVKAWTSWKTGHDELAARSSYGTSSVVSDTGHFIQIDQPDAVVDAVKRVVEAARRSRSKVR